VQRYADYLGSRQASVQAIVANAKVLHEYKVVLNGFAAMLTDDEVRQLKASAAVEDIVADEARYPVTSFTPTFLGLDKPGGLWSQLGGSEHAGEGVVVGIIDSGIWPENPAYADRVDANGKPTFDNSGKLVYDAPPAGWQGACQTGEAFTAGHCNNKLIGARYFDESFRALGDLYVVERVPLAARFAGRAVRQRRPRHAHVHHRGGQSRRGFLHQWRLRGHAVRHGAACARRGL
jgi:subtilisin family serine protease